MRACVCACMHACVRASMRACEHACVRASMRTCERACVHVYVCVRESGGVFVVAYVFVCKCDVTLPAFV